MDTTSNNINFGTRTLYPLKITAKSGELVKANFAEISPKSQNDLNFINSLFFNWRHTASPDKCIANIKIDFNKDFQKSGTREPIYKYFITRLTSKRGKTPLKTCSASSIKTFDDILEIKQLQSATNVITKGTTVPKVKGAGELNVLGIVKYAKEHGLKRIELVSMCDDFYEKLGFKKIVRNEAISLPDANTHYLDNGMFDTFINRVQQKYKMN